MATVENRAGTVSGSKSMRRFEAALGAILSVPREDYEKIAEQAKAERALKPKRGPKKKTAA